MCKYRGIIFDLDGTLLDTIEDIGDSMNEVLRSLDFPIFSYDEYKLKVGGGFKGLVISSCPEGTNREIIDKSIDLFSNSYDKNYLNKTKPYDGIIHILNILNENKIKLGVNSNKRNNYTNRLVDKFFHNIPFVKVFGVRDGVNKKPDPSAALEIAKAMNLSIDEILYIGDSKTDILTAKNAGMDSVGVLWGFRDREEFEKYGADFIVKNPTEILDLIGV